MREEGMRFVMGDEVTLDSDWAVIVMDWECGVCWMRAQPQGSTVLGISAVYVCMYVCVWFY